MWNSTPSSVVVEDRILNGYNNISRYAHMTLLVVEDRILNGYNNRHPRDRHRTRVVEDRILNGYNNIRRTGNGMGLL